jgi:HAD superfamily hydrolase (TIGR01509 family)
VPSKGVLWDMDGVIVDTGDCHYWSWSKLLPRYGIRYSRELFRATFGMNNVQTLKTLVGHELAPQLVAEISERKEELFRRGVRGRVQPLPGVVHWLERLKAAGWKQGIASSGPPANIDALVDELGLRGWFDALVSGADLPGKPDPALFLHVAWTIEVPPQRCVVIEDALAGVEAARRAGMKCIAVTTTNPAQALEAADMVVDRLDDLPADAFQRLLDRTELP